jgi:uncharacterized protein (DUF305 family)
MTTPATPKWSEVQLQHGTDEQVKRLARKIIEDQRKEIAEIDAWLAKNRR